MACRWSVDHTFVDELHNPRYGSACVHSKRKVLLQNMHVPPFSLHVHHSLWSHLLLSHSLHLKAFIHFDHHCWTEYGGAILTLTTKRYVTPHGICFIYLEYKLF